MEDFIDGANDDILVVSLLDKDSVKYAVPELVTEDKQGRPKGDVHGLRHDGTVLNGDKLTNEERERARIQSSSSVRVYTTYTNNEEPLNSGLRSVTFAGTGTVLCKATDTTGMSTARVVTSDRAVSDRMPKVDNIPEEQRRKYAISSVTADPNVRAGSRYKDEHWSCEKLNSMTDNLKLLRKVTPSLEADFSFLKCSGSKDSVEGKTVMVPSLPSVLPKRQPSQGVGYPGTDPVRREDMFKGRGDRQTLVRGNVKTGSSLDVHHELPTKPGMSGTTIAEAGTPSNTFQYPTQNYGNGAVSTNNPAFILQYEEHIVKEMPTNLPERTQGTKFVQQAGDEQQKEVDGWLSKLWKH